MLVDAQVDDLVGEPGVPAVSLDDEERCRLLPAPIAARRLSRVEAVEQPLGERARAYFEGVCDCVDSLGRDQNVALGGIAGSGSASGPLHALVAGVGCGAALAVDDAELPVVASFVGCGKAFDDLFRAEPFVQEREAARAVARVRVGLGRDRADFGLCPGDD